MKLAGIIAKAIAIKKIMAKLLPIEFCSFKSTVNGIG